MDRVFPARRWRNQARPKQGNDGTHVSAQHGARHSVPKAVVQSLALCFYVYIHPPLKSNS